jgi:hypothetical protein
LIAPESSVLKGHGFSRAENAAKRTWALHAAEKSYTWQRFEGARL